MQDIYSAGEDALIVYLGSSTDPAVAARVQAACAAIEQSLGADLIDLVPSYASVLVIYNPLQTDHLAVRERLHSVLDNLVVASATESQLITLPCYYNIESGPDLESVASAAGLTVEAVIDIHQTTEYRVYAIGFAPGFAYLGEVDQRIATPRLKTPRQKVPRGAVAIADRQTAVYPAPSPGGWNLIGLCPVRMFDPTAQPIMPVNVGDRVRFEAISKQQYVAAGGVL